MLQWRLLWWLSGEECVQMQETQVRFHLWEDPAHCEPHQTVLWSPGATTVEPTCCNYKSLCSLEPVLCSKKSCCNEKPSLHNQRVAPAPSNRRKPSNNTRDNSTHGHHQRVNTETRLIIFYAAQDGESLYSQQKQDRELTVPQIMSSLFQNSDSN